MTAIANDTANTTAVIMAVMGERPGSWKIKAEISKIHIRCAKILGQCSGGGYGYSFHILQDTRFFF